MLQNDIVLECRNLSHSFGDICVLYDVNLKIIRGEIVALVGKTGAGKSTLLRAILGTHLPREGQIIVTNIEGERSVVKEPGRDRGIVYQHYSLFPFLTAQENVALGLMLDRTSIPSRLLRYPRWRKLRKQHMEEAAAILEKVQLGEDLDKYPHQLSGGMKQRAAIAQALVMKPEILLLDEPFGAVDEATREDLQQMLLGLYDENCKAKERNEPPSATILIVTHELNEAIYVGDRVIALSRYWHWQDEHKECPGATIVYDEMAPVNLPDQEKDFDKFAKQRAAIRAAAFDPASQHKPEDFRNFWQDVREGFGTGVLELLWECKDEQSCLLRDVCGLIREIRRIKKSASSTDEQKGVPSKLELAVQERAHLFENVFAPRSHDPGRLEQVRRTAAQDCFWYPARKTLSYLDKHAPHAREELAKHLCQILDIIERNDDPKQTLDD